MSLLSDIRNVFVTELGIPDEELTMGLKYGETPEWDSNSHMILILALEEAFNVTFESDEIVTLVTLNSIHEALLQKGIANRSHD